jgi:uncharacterized protein (TIGR02145 family)
MKTLFPFYWYRPLPTFSVVLTTIVLVFFATSCNQDDDVANGGSSNTNPPSNNGGADQEGNAITSVIIGTQEWMSENLSVTSYRDGTPIPKVTDSNEWASLTTGAWCWYNNDSAAYAATYGRLYNWYAVAGIHNTASLSNTALRKQLAPTGWHVPTDAEWTVLTDYLGGEGVAGGKMKTMGTLEAATGLWYDPNAGATNSSGFSGAPGGVRGDNGEYNGIGYVCFWWSSSEYDAFIAWCRSLYYSSGLANSGFSHKQVGYSVRCLRD